MTCFHTANFNKSEQSLLLTSLPQNSSSCLTFIFWRERRCSLPRLFRSLKLPLPLKRPVLKFRTELLGRTPFPGNLIPFCPHRHFTGLTGVCSSSSAFCRLLNFTLVWNFAVANSLKFSYVCIDKKPLWNPFSGSCCSQVFLRITVY